MSKPIEKKITQEDKITLEHVNGVDKNSIPKFLEHIMKFCSSFGCHSLLDSIKCFPNHRMFYFDDFYKILEGYDIFGSLEEKAKMNDFQIEHDLTINIESKQKNVTKLLFSVNRQALCDFQHGFLEKHIPSLPCDDIDKHMDDPKYSNFYKNGVIRDEVEFLKYFKTVMFDEIQTTLKNNLYNFGDNNKMTPESKIREVFFKQFPRFDKVLFELLQKTIKNKLSAENTTNFQNCYNVEELTNKIGTVDFSNYGASLEANINEENLKKQTEKDKKQIYESGLYYHLKAAYADNVVGQDREVVRINNDHLYNSKLYDDFDQINRNTSFKKDEYEQQNIIQSEGKFMTRKGEIFDRPKKYPELKDTLIKIKPVLEKSLNDRDDPETKFYSFPIFKECVSEDRCQNSYLWAMHFMVIIQDMFTDLNDMELKQITALGNNFDNDREKIDYMKVCKEIDKIFSFENIF